jgi:hypothetical protein
MKILLGSWKHKIRFRATVLHIYEKIFSEKLSANYRFDVLIFQLITVALKITASHLSSLLFAPSPPLRWAGLGC